MEIRQATIKDLESLAILLNGLEDFNFSFSKPDPEEICSMEDIREILKGYFKSPEKAAVFIAEENNEPVGYVHVYHNEYGNHCVLEDLFVLEKYRKNGTGKKLLIKAEEWAKERSTNLKLEVLDWNKYAQEFYERNGYEMDSIVYIKWF